MAMTTQAETTGVRKRFQYDGAYHAFIAQIRVGTDHQQASQEGEADAHDDGQLGADLPDGIELENGADTGGEHGALEELGDLHRGQVAVGAPHQGGAAHDEHRRQVGDEHGQHVLQAEGNRLGQRDPPVQPIDVVCADGFDDRFLVFHRSHLTLNPMLYKNLFFFQNYIFLIGVAESPLRYTGTDRMVSAASTSGGDGILRWVS